MKYKSFTKVRHFVSCSVEVDSFGSDEDMGMSPELPKPSILVEERKPSKSKPP